VALAALVTPVRQLPGTRVTALRANEPLRPPQPVQTVSVGPKLRLELAQRPGIVRSGQWGRGHSAILLRLNGYPTIFYYTRPSIVVEPPAHP